MMKAFGIKKRDRLYMALYQRGVSYEGDVRYHTALLRIPKGAGVDDKEATAYRYHAVNPIVNAQQVWRFETVKTRPTSIKLRALLFLGKMEITALELEEILEQVSVVQDDREWRCHNWIWAAMELLVHEGVIDPLPRQPQDIWNATMKFADDNPIDTSDGLVPTCATDGTHIKSAFDGL